MSDIEQIEVSMEHVKKLIKARDMAVKLTSNREFKSLILETYFQTEAARLVSLLAEPEAIKHRDEIMESMHGIAQLQAFLRNTVRMGDMAAAELKDYESELEEVRASDESGD